MQLTMQEAERLMKEGVQALHERRPADARRVFETLVGTGRAGGKVWLFLAMACRDQQDAAAEEQALDRLLELEPQFIKGLIMKADCRAKAGDEWVAANLYKSALRLGSLQPVSQTDAAELRRAEAAVKALEERQSGQIRAELTAKGLPEEDRSPRFQRSLDILARRKQIYWQEPTSFYFPEMPQIQFYDPSVFDWAPAVEAAAGAIREELSALMAQGFEGFQPYLRSKANEPRSNPLLDSRDWSAFFLVENNEHFDAAIARCPKTWEAVQAAPLPQVDRLNTVMFSLLRPNTRISAHNGMYNIRLVCHLPLIVPPGCGFRVGNEVRQWEEGKLLIFDDSIEHEAWNESGEDRVVLIFNIWRPELSARERAELSVLFSIPDPAAADGGSA